VFRLDGKVALVTGAGEGITLVLACQGAQVVINDIAPERAMRAAQAPRTAGGRAAPAVFDATSNTAVADGVARVAGKKPTP
jgi:NAD(P)-dependent dehydrogenase (short-subunit alcohol dehydrogenase family)